MKFCENKWETTTKMCKKLERITCYTDPSVFPLAVVLACVTSYGWHCYHQETALFFAKVPGDRTDICSIRIASQSPPVAALTKFQFQNGIYV